MASRIIRQTFLSKKPKRDSFVTAFIIFSVILFFSLFYWRMDIAEAFLSSGKTVFEEGQWIQLMVSPYFHGDGKHFLSNVSMLGVMSFFIYGYYGWRPLLWLLGPLTWLIQLSTLYFYPPEVRLLGISGGVYACCAFWVAVYMGVERRRAPVKRLLRAAGFSIMILLPTTFEPTTSYLAHGIGFVVGALYGAFYFFLHKNYFRAWEVWEETEPLDH